MPCVKLRSGVNVKTQKTDCNGQKLGNITIPGDTEGTLVHQNEGLCIVDFGGYCAVIACQGLIDCETGEAICE